MGGKNSGRGPRPNRKKMKSGKLDIRISPELLARLKRASDCLSMGDVKVSQSDIVGAALVEYLCKMILPDADGYCKPAELIV